MSLMIVSSPSPERRTVSRNERCWSFSGVSSSSSVRPSTPFIGVRISWLMLARNSDLAAFAFSAAAMATDSSCPRVISACSASARSVVSKNTV